MKNTLVILLLLVTLYSCESNKVEPSESFTLVEMFLNDVNAILKDTTKNPIVTFSDLAANQAQATFELNKESVAGALEKAKGYGNAVIVVENHTIVKLFGLEDCQKSGSWGACMPKGEGFIKKGQLNYKSDYINNIIGIPSSKKVTLYLFNLAASATEPLQTQEAENKIEIEQVQEDTIEIIAADQDCIYDFDVCHESSCGWQMYSTKRLVSLPFERYITDGEARLTSFSSEPSEAWVYFYNKDSVCVATFNGQPTNRDTISVTLVAAENFSLPVNISYYTFSSNWNDSSLEYLQLCYNPTNDPDYHECGL